MLGLILPNGMVKNVVIFNSYDKTEEIVVVGRVALPASRH